MIITCPSCETRYRQPAATAETPVTCSCSRCEAVFPSDSPAPSGIVLSVAARLEPDTPAIPPTLVLPVDGPIPDEQPGIADLPIGMDDPTLASKIQAKGFAATAGTAPMAYSSVPEDQPEPEQEPEPETEVEAKPTREQKKQEKIEKKAAKSRERRRAPRDTRPGFGAFMVVTCLPTAMAAGAWQLSTMFAEDPVVWTTPAGVLGLLFSWLWVRWKYRER